MVFQTSPPLVIFIKEFIMKICMHTFLHHSRDMNKMIHENTWNIFKEESMLNSMFKKNKAMADVMIIKKVILHKQEVF